MKGLIGIKPHWKISKPVEDVNGRDKQHTSAPGFALRSSRRTSPKGACPHPLTLGGGGEIGLEPRPVSAETYIKSRCDLTKLPGMKQLQLFSFGGKTYL